MLADQAAKRPAAAPVEAPGGRPAPDVEVPVPPEPEEAEAGDDGVQGTEAEDAESAESTNDGAPSEEIEKGVD